MALTQVSTSGIKDATVATADIADNAVTAGKLASGVQTTINNNADDRVITGSGTANTLNGESDLIFDGTKLGIGMTPGSGTGYLLQLDSGEAQTFMTFGNSGSGNGASNGLVIGNDTSRAYITQRENQPIFVATNNVDRLAIDADGNVGIGTTSPNSFSNYTTVTINGGSDGAGIDLELNDNNIYGRVFADANGVQIQSAQSGDYIRFETNGSNERVRITSTGNLEKRGGGSYFAYNSSGYYAKQDNYDSTGGKSYWYDGGSGNNNIVASVDGQTGNIMAKGNFVVGTAGKGIDFSATSDASGNSSELLDDYEEGSWTPSTTRWSVSESTANAGKYTKIGNFVQISWNQSLTVVNGGYTGSGSGAAIGGLPFAIADCAVVSFSGSSLWTSTLGSLDNIGNELFFRPNPYSSSGVATDSMFNSSGVVKITATYRTS